MQNPIFPLKFKMQTESVRLRVPTLFLSLEIPVFLLSAVMSMNSRLLSTGAETDSLCWIILLEKSPKKSGRGWPHHRSKMFWNHNCLLAMVWGDQWLPSCRHKKNKGCLQLSCLKPHSFILHHASRKIMFHGFSHEFHMIFSPHNPYGSSRICTEEIQPQLKWHHYSTYLFLRR